VHGVFGSRTAKAVEQALARRGDQLPAGAAGWPASRRAVACFQLFCRERGIEVGAIDGRWGPQTGFAAASLAHLLEHGALPEPWRRDLPLTPNPNRWPSRSEAELIAFYGEPGDQTNLTRLELPYPLRLAWEKRTVVRSLSCHRLVRDSLHQVFTALLNHYGREQLRALRLDLYGGCLNIRKERGGEQWSTHAWGIALDFDPERNQLKWDRERAAFARPEYAPWWRIWEEEGWVSLGRTRNYDWMHVQAARL
jgi:hypothetical protein